ncbi:MAG: tryptophan 2,3-dioxygenase family protein [Gemmatimonas sp.]
MTNEAHSGTSHSPNDIHYGDYLKLKELLSLQTPQSQPEHPDELLFIVVHQASELWFKVLLHEIDAMVSALQGFNTMHSLLAVRRVNALMSIVASQLSALDTLPPQRFAQFRTYLGTSSGSQSVQFRAIEAASGLRDPHFIQALTEHGPMPENVSKILERPTLQQLFEDLVARENTTLEELYTGPAPTPLFLLAEGLLEYEQHFARWRFLHVQLVERIIGPQTGGTGGTLGAKYLQRTIAHRFFPSLWAVRAKFYGAR